MTLTHLIPLSQFVDKIDEIVRQKNSYAGDWRISQLRAIKRYTALILQDNAKWMFVPVSESGEVLEEPPHTTAPDGDSESRIIEYHQAKEKCLFEGFELINNKFFLNEKLIWFAELKGKIEDLDHLNLPLTAQAIKQILG